MIWLNAAAWFGLAALAIPIAVHLIGRRRPVRHLFPTLRFLPASALTPSRRRRVQAPWLLAVRLAMVTAAVAALAGPLVLSAARRARLDATAARAIVVDTSASMTRRMADGTEAIGAARRRAGAIAAEAATSRIVEGARLGAAIASAAAWLGTQPGRRELIVLSDFHDGTMTAADLASAPPDAAIRTERIAGVAPRETTGDALALPEGTFEVHLRADEDGTTATWSPAAAASPALPVLLSAADASAGDRDVVSRAALTLGVPAGAGTRSVSVIFPGAPDRDRELASAPMPDAPWMFDVGARARRALRDGVLPQFRMRPPSTLVVFPATDVASAASARLLGEIARAIASTIDLAEREPRMIADVERERWTREPGARAAGAAASAGDSDGRWLWLAVLVLFAVEWRVRRHARVA